MICPDIWQLPPPDSHIRHQQGRLDERAEHQLGRTIESHYLNNLISIVVPDTTVVPPELGAVLADTDHYVVEDCRLSEFVKRRFIEAFVKRGHLYGLSVGTRIDCDECAALTPGGSGTDAPTLHLALNKDVFQSLGLEGSVSYFTQKTRDRYNIRLNLLDPNLSPDTKYFARVHNALADDEVLPRLAMRLAWQPSADTAACSSSVAKYFADAGYQVRLIQTARIQRPEYSLRVPLLGRDETAEAAGSEFFATPGDLIEYLGMVSLGCDLEATDPYLSAYRCLGRSMEVGNATVAQWRGLFATDTVKRLLAQLREYIAARPHLPWVSLYCSGFAHAPVSFGHKEHTFGMGQGDNAYAIVLGGDGEYQLTTVLGSNKMMK